jgi:hypothetical protein
MRSGRATPGYLYNENQDGRTGRCPLGSDGSTQNPPENPSINIATPPFAKPFGTDTHQRAALNGIAFSP